MALGILVCWEFPMGEFLMIEVMGSVFPHIAPVNGTRCMTGFPSLSRMDDCTIFIWGRTLGILEGEVKGPKRVTGEDLGPNTQTFSWTWVIVRLAGGRRSWTCIELGPRGPDDLGRMAAVDDVVESLAARDVEEEERVVFWRTDWREEGVALLTYAPLVCSRLVAGTVLPPVANVLTVMIEVAVTPSGGDAQTVWHTGVETNLVSIETDDSSPEAFTSREEQGTLNCGGSELITRDVCGAVALAKLFPEVKSWSTGVSPDWLETTLVACGILVDDNEVKVMDVVVVRAAGVVTWMTGDTTGAAEMTVVRVVLWGVWVLPAPLCKVMDEVKVCMEVSSWEGFMCVICCVEIEWRWDLDEVGLVSFWLEWLLIWRRLNPDIPVTLIADLFESTVVTQAVWDEEDTTWSELGLFLVLVVLDNGRALKSLGKFKSLWDILTRMEKMADGILLRTSGGMVAGLLDLGRNSISNSPMWMRQGGGYPSERNWRSPVPWLICREIRDRIFCLWGSQLQLDRISRSLTPWPSFSVGGLLLFRHTHWVCHMASAWKYTDISPSHFMNSTDNSESDEICNWFVINLSDQVTNRSYQIYISFLLLILWIDKL